MIQGGNTAAGSAATGTIAVVLKGYPRLSETFIAQELKGLEDRGFKLHFVSLRHPTDSTRHPIHDEIRASVNYLPEYLHHEPSRVLKGVLRAIMMRGFMRALGRWAGDLRRDFSRNRVRRFGQACVMASELPRDATWLYAHFIHTPAAVTAYASLMSGLPWSCSAHAKDIWTSPDWELKQNLDEVEWVATCTAVGWRHLQNLTIAPGKVHLIYHGLDLSRFPAPAPERRQMRDGSDPKAPLRLLSVGRAVQKKGFDTLLNALAELPADLHWEWVHIGGGGELASLKRMAAAGGVDDRISWLGALAQNEVLDAYRTADLFVLPCRITEDGDRDGLPNVLVEAQSQRLACISTPISGIPELIDDGETGMLVPPDDARALAEAITVLGRDPGRRQVLAVAGEARVRASFDMHGGLAALARLFPTTALAARKRGRGAPDDDHAEAAE